MNKKIVVSFELSLIILSIFAFAFIIYSSTFAFAQSGSNTPANPSNSLWSGVPVYSEGSALGAGTYNSGTISWGNEVVELTGGQTATITQTGETFKVVITGRDGKIIKTAGELTTPPTAGTEVTGVAGKGSSALSRFFGAGAGSATDALLTGLQWAVVAYGIGQLVGGLLGLESQNVDALSTSLAAGAFVYQGLETFQIAGNERFFFHVSEKSFFQPLGYGVLAAAIVFVIMYKDTKVETVTFSCLPYQAPNGGGNCEICNDDELPCSEYRCKSLGQSCALLNKGTDQEKCVNVAPNDVNPPIIEPAADRLTSGHGYTNVRRNPPSPGFEIKNLQSSDGCLKAFTPLTFGINTDEPSQCKIDFEHTTSFDEMSSYVGGINLYSYNHTERFVLPNTEDFENSSIVLENGKDLTFFLRCQDSNGNFNSAEFAVEFCIDPSPDTTPPRIEATSVLNEGCIAEDQSSANVDFYTNEPSNCRWDIIDQDYDLMDNEMTCSNELYQMNAMQLFTCKTELSGVTRDGTDYFIRCKDQPRKDENLRNEMMESYKFNLRGSTGLRVDKLQPNGTIFGGVSPTSVELYVETSFGCNDGRSMCFYSDTGETGDFITFFDTNNEDGISTQPLSLTDGQHDIFVQCVDAGGNLAEETISFDLEIDENAPVIARVYEEDSLLKIVTVRNSECSYTLNDCGFTFDEGTQMPYANTTVHVTEWNRDNTYYIKCRDEFRNEDADCSLVVRPTQNFL